MAQVNVRSAFGIIKRSDLIITDRLHAHVLATLCGIQNLVLDNSYGKISSMYDDYSGRFSNAKLCLSVEELNLYLADWKFDHSDELVNQQQFRST
jgi:pyruvyl transferase EpsO